MRTKSLSLVFSLVSVLGLTSLACTGGDDDGGGADAAINLVDGGGGLPDGGGGLADAAAGCTVPANVVLAPSDQNSAVLLVTTPAPARYIFNYITGAGTQGVDEFFQFRINSPVTVPSTINFVDGCAQGSPQCWVLLGNYTAVNNMLDGDVYFARAGTMNITAAGQVGGQFTATITGARFDHYVDMGGGLVPAPDGCQLTVTDGTVDIIVAAPAKPGEPSNELMIAPLDLTR